MNIFMLPLDVTNSAMLTKRELESVKSIYTPFGTTMYDLLVYYLGTAFAQIVPFFSDGGFTFVINNHPKISIGKVNENSLR